MTSYDAISYPGYAYRQTHPDRLRTVARLIGLEAPPAERCRVLELGCGDGGNLIPMASSLPESEFVGIDLTAEHIRRGQAIASELGLHNITLRRQDLMDFDDADGEFDYVIAYGLWSWVPGPVSERIFEIAAKRLSQRGVAYVNFNACPLGRLRQMVREMMLYASRGAEDPGERIRRASALLEMLANSPALEGEYGAVIKAEVNRLARRDKAFLFHDELSDVYRPAYFHEFMERAAAHGLQYVAEATLSDSHTAAITQGEGILEREQYLDFLKGRAFRHTLLCHAGVHLEHGLKFEVMPKLFAASSASATDTGDGVIEFRSAHGGLKTAHPLAKAALQPLVDAWPRAVSVAELAQRTGEEHAASIAEMLLSAAAGGIVDLYSTPPRIAARPGERPLAHALARLQARSGTKIGTLLHTYISVDDEMGRRLIRLLDGTRDRAALVRELSPARPEATPEQLATELETSLASLCRFGILVDNE